MKTLFQGSNPVKAAQVLFLGNAVIWLVFGLLSLTRMANNGVGPFAASLIAILMIGNVAVMVIAGIGIGTQKRWLYYFAIVVVAVNILLTITDEFGIFDFITLVLDLVLLGLLFVIRRRAS